MMEIEEEIVDYLKENELYYVEEYDEEGFPVDDEAYDLVGNLTNTELCDIVSDSMEYIAEVQRKKDIEKACDIYSKELKEIIDILNKVGKMRGIEELGDILSYDGCVRDFRKAMEGED